MIDDKKVLSFIGLSRKAGAAQVGSFLSIEAVRDKKAKMLIVATDASKNTKEECEDAKSIKKLTVVERFTKQELGYMLGKNEVTVVAITKKDFSDNLKKLLEIN